MLSNEAAIIACERYVLGMIYASPESLPTVYRLTKPCVFYFKEHKLLYEAFINIALQGKPVEYQAVLDYLQKYHMGATISDPSYLAALLRDIAIEYWCRRREILNFLSLPMQAHMQSNACRQ